MSTAHDPSAMSAGARRRDVLVGGGGLLLGAGLAVAANALHSSPARPTPAATATDPAPVPAYGTTQAGIVSPAVPQSHVEIVVLDRDPELAPADLWAAVGRHVAELTAGPVAGRARTDLTVTVGVGLDDARAVHPDLSWPEPLPTFARDRLGSATGGDLVLQVCATAPEVVGEATSDLLRRLEGSASRRWSQAGLRGAQDSRGVFRNGMGFADGIINPRTVEAQATGVWDGVLGGPGPRDGSTFMVVRRMRVDLEAWGRLDDRTQSEVIGRDKATGEPLSGGVRDDEVDLGAKHSDGRYRVPAGSHARRAHPSFIGRPLMLRRGYGFAGAGEGTIGDQGVLFISYQSDLATFVLTQHRLDEGDDLMTFTTVTGSGAFWVPRGFQRNRSLGA